MMFREKRIQVLDTDKLAVGNFIELMVMDHDYDDNEELYVYDSHPLNGLIRASYETYFTITLCDGTVRQINIEDVVSNDNPTDTPKRYRIIATASTLKEVE